MDFKKIKIVNTSYSAKDDSFDDIKQLANAGKVLTINSTGDGIEISASNEVSVNEGDGLAINATSKAVEVAVGDGLAIDSTSKKVIVVGEKGISVDSTSKKVVIDNAITQQDTQAVYPVTLTAQGLVSTYGNAVKTAKKVSATLGAAETTKTITLTSSQELLDFFAVDASGNKVMLDVAVATTGVTFSVPTAAGEAIMCYVVYQDTAIQD